MYVARGMFLPGFCRSPPVKLITAKPRYAKKVSATLETTALAEGYPLGASRWVSRWVRVTSTKIAKTASKAMTMTDCARSTVRGPTMHKNAVASTSADAKNLVQSVELLSPTTMALAYSPNETATIAPTTTMAVR